MGTFIVLSTVVFMLLAFIWSSSGPVDVVIKGMFTVLTFYGAILIVEGKLYLAQ